MIKQSSWPSSPSLLCLFLFLLIAARNGGIFRSAEGGKIHITDDLDDVADDEEDEAWKEWGKKSAKSTPEFDPPPTDFSGMDLQEIQAEMMKRQLGPAFGFVKLRLGARRTPEMVSEIAMKWTKISRTGSIEVKFMGVDVSTIMFSMEKGQDSLELKEFLLSQPEAYEVKIGDHLFRRPGDPPFEEVFEKLHSDQGKAGHISSLKEDRQQNDEL
ncbi:hypothetical protein RJ639_045196 [Escallonia herrerae]|uniref:Mesoderm development candidate 2 n=1 Tax=Escallonia herrerae TaxID=1293975 RepID=A0AA89B0D2_9ASTE|nr:hypothetical protein RJ639_045196 [Escallonia herrerae]